MTATLTFGQPEATAGRATLAALAAREMRRFALNPVFLLAVALMVYALWGRPGHRYRDRHREPVPGDLPRRVRHDGHVLANPVDARQRTGRRRHPGHPAGPRAGQGQDLTIVLLDMFTSPYKYMRSRALHALARRQGQDVTGALIATLADHDKDMQRAAVQVLAGREGKDVTAGLLAVLADPDPGVRHNAVVTLASRDLAEVLAGREGQDVIARADRCPR